MIEVSDIGFVRLWYVATVYTKYHRGWHGAYIDAAKITARIHRRYKIGLFSPIAHGHGMTTHGDLPAVDHQFWKRFNAPFIEACGGCLVVKMDGWQESRGIKDEIDDFRAAKKTVLFIDPETLEVGIT